MLSVKGMARFTCAHTEDPGVELIARGIQTVALPRSQSADVQTGKSATLAWCFFFPRRSVSESGSPNSPKPLSLFPPALPARIGSSTRLFTAVSLRCNIQL